MKKTVFSILFFFTVLSVQCQNVKQINKQIDSLFAECQNLFEADKFEATIPIFKRLDGLCLSVDNHTYYIYSLIYRLRAYYDLLRYEDMKPLLIQTKQDMEKYDVTYEGLKMDLSYLQACYYFDQGNIDLAENYFVPILSCNWDEFGFRKDDVYNNLGLIYYRRGDYQKSITYFKKAISVERKTKNFSSVRARWEKNIADAYHYLEDYQQAHLHYKKSQSIIETYPINKTTRRYYTDIYEHLGEYFHTVDKYDSAHHYLDLALSLKPEENVLINYHKNKGVTYLKEQQFGKAQQSLQIAEAKSIALYSERHDKLAETYLSIGEVYKKQNNYTDALAYFQKALIASTVDFDNPDPKINPATDRRLSRLSTLNSLVAKASVFSLLDNHEAALENYDRAQMLIEEMLSKNIIASESRFFLVNKSKNLYESAIQTAIKKGDLPKAFSFSQKSHGLILWQNFQENQATKNSGIPDSLLVKEQNLKIDISEAERQLYQAHHNDQADKISSYENRIFDLNMKYQDLLKSLETNYPKFYQLKYLKLDAPSVSAIQSKLLDRETALYEYFVGEEKIYLFTITKNELRVFEKEIPEDFTNLISAFRSSLSEPNSEKFDSYCEHAQLLYDLLLADSMSASAKVKNIIVIPDEALNYIPFAALLSSVPPEAKNNARYDLLPFLVHDYNFSYNYSSALFPKQKHSTSDEELLVGYAPSFLADQDEQTDLDSLLFNVEEVLMINKVVGGHMYLDDHATLDQFKKDIDNYKIVHLATHATCNDSIPADSKIHFHEQPLYANEIYNLPHQLSMAVLSACETGSGKIRKGEGIISMARAFISSGCPSVITSLWKVKDEQTSQIMSHFYAHLKNGEQKNVALNQAKRDYLNENTTSSYYHPYYWATFVPIGNVESIVEMSDSKIYYLLLFFVIIALILLWLKFKK